MTVKELKQYRSICKEIDEKNIALEDNTVRGAVRGSMIEFPYTERTIKIDGVLHSSENIKRFNRIKILEHKKQCIENFVDSIEDSLTRRIFEYRYIIGDKRISWQEIAFKIGEHDESYPRRKHNKFLKLAENVENDVL